MLFLIICAIAICYYLWDRKFRTFYVDIVESTGSAGAAYTVSEYCPNMPIEAAQYLVTDAPYIIKFEGGRSWAADFVEKMVEQGDNVKLISVWPWEKSPVEGAHAVGDPYTKRDVGFQGVGSDE